jgi:hypothetical protein
MWVPLERSGNFKRIPMLELLSLLVNKIWELTNHLWFPPPSLVQSQPPRAGDWVSPARGPMHAIMWSKLHLNLCENSSSKSSLKTLKTPQIFLKKFLIFFFVLRMDKIIKSLQILKTTKVVNFSPKRLEDLYLVFFPLLWWWPKFLDEYNFGCHIEESQVV